MKPVVLPVNRRLYLLLLAAIGLFSGAAFSQKAPQKGGSSGYAAYLFAYFTGNSKAEEQICFALSKDGYLYRALNGNRPVVSSAAISQTGGVRDPHIMRGANGTTFYMVATDMVSANGWNSNRAMVLMKSNDLIHWTSSVVNIQQKYPGQDSLLRVWAPQTIYDDSAKKYLVYFSLKYGREPDKICYAYANAEFTDLEGEPKQLFYSPDGAACIDGDLINKDGKYYLLFKTEERQPGIKIAVSNHLTGGYTMQSPDYVQQTKSPVEGAGTFQLNDGSGYILMYDMYTSGRYQFTKTTDLKKFTVVDEVSMNFHPRHGTVLPITAEEAKRLAEKWLQPQDVVLSATNPAIRPINTVFDTATRSIYFSAKPGVDLKKFQPAFTVYPGVSISPTAPQNFTRGGVQYSVSIGGRAAGSFTVFIKEQHNPALTGYYADPEVLYAEKTGKFYLYPTSDGFNGWSGTFFKTFSSPDLVNWTDEGKIMQLGDDVKWAARNAWAPCIVEKKIAGQYRYFYYFTAAQKIGVAVANNPTGPFRDLGRPLVDKKPEGVKDGQEIDPDVFTDPQTGKSYLYWGNGYMAVAELNADMTSLKEGSQQLLTPPRSFREGTYVFYRQGKYYFLWSEDDTRSPDYQVAYGIANSPVGPVVLPENNVIIKKDTAAGIYGTGHNSVIQLPGKEEWYMVYHRFNYPKGIRMGGAAGYNREVCIDRLVFNADGTIQPVKPTHEGIQPVKPGK